MLHVSFEDPASSDRRLRAVIAAASVNVYDRPHVFLETPLADGVPDVDSGTLALVRDDEVWARLVPWEPGMEAERFGLVRFHFPAEMDNSGFVGWIATHLKRRLGTGVFVTCGQNSNSGGIFDYLGFPEELRDAVLEEIDLLRGDARTAGGDAQEEDGRRDDPTH